MPGFMNLTIGRAHLEALKTQITSKRIRLVY